MRRRVAPDDRVTERALCLIGAEQSAGSRAGWTRLADVCGAPTGQARASEERNCCRALDRGPARHVSLVRPRWRLSNWSVRAFGHHTEIGSGRGRGPSASLPGHPHRPSTGPSAAAAIRPRPAVEPSDPGRDEPESPTFRSETDRPIRCDGRHLRTSSIQNIVDGARHLG